MKLMISWCIFLRVRIVPCAHKNLFVTTSLVDIEDWGFTTDPNPTFMYMMFPHFEIHWQNGRFTLRIIVSIDCKKVKNTSLWPNKKGENFDPIKRGNFDPIKRVDFDSIRRGKFWPIKKGGNFLPNKKGGNFDPI